MWIVYALSASLVWGLEYTLAEQLLRRKISPITLTVLQMLGGGLIFLILTVTRGKLQDYRTLTQDHQLFGLTVLNVIGFGLGNFFVACAIANKNATAASLLEVSYPLAVVLFTWLLFREVHLNLGTMLGGAFILLGVTLMYVLG